MVVNVLILCTICKKTTSLLKCPREEDTMCGLDLTFSPHVSIIVMTFPDLLTLIKPLIYSLVTTNQSFYILITLGHAYWHLYDSVITALIRRPINTLQTLTVSAGIGLWTLRIISADSCGIWLVVITCGVLETVIDNTLAIL